MLVLLLRLRRGIQDYDRPFFRVFGNDASYTGVVELDVNFEDPRRIVAHGFPELLVVDGTAVSIVCHAIRRSEEFGDLLPGRMSGFNFGNICQTDIARERS